MKLLFTCVLLAIRVASIASVLKAVFLVLDLALLFINMPLISGMTKLEYFRGNDGISLVAKPLGYGILGFILAAKSSRIAAWLVPVAVAQCTTCGHPLPPPGDVDASKPARTHSICSECGCRQPS